MAYGRKNIHVERGADQLASAIVASVACDVPGGTHGGKHQEQQTRTHDLQVRTAYSPVLSLLSERNTCSGERMIMPIEPFALRHKDRLQRLLQQCNRSSELRPLCTSS